MRVSAALAARATLNANGRKTALLLATTARRLRVLVLVMTTPPRATRFVAAQRRAIQPLVHAPQSIQSARVGRVGVEDDVVFQHEGAHAGSFPDIRERIGSTHARELADRALVAEAGTPFRDLPSFHLAARRLHRGLAAIVVFGAAFPLLLFGDADREVGVEVAAERRSPGKRPAHSLLA